MGREKNDIHMKSIKKKNEYIHILYILCGVTLFSTAYKYFLIPDGLYSGGFAGVAQIIKWLVIEVFGVHVPPNIDIAGIITWFINIPLMIMGYQSIGKRFIYRTIIAVCVQSFLMTFLPSPETPFFKDTLLNCLIGGTISGCGVGLALREGGSGGGTDIVGMICSKKYPDISVGKIGLLINFLVYLFAAIEFNLEVAAYSLVFSLVAAVMVDKIHSQNIKYTAFIVSRDQQLGKRLTDFIGRGVTSWDGWGEYSQNNQIVHMIVINKYEWQYLKRYIVQEEPAAFAFIVSPQMVVGKFEKRLEVN